MQNNNTSDVVIVGAARTPMAAMLGEFSGLPAHALGSVAIKAAVERSGLSADLIDEVIMGNVLMAGQGQAPARQAALAAGLPESSGCSTINKMCGSGMQAVRFAHDQLQVGTNRLMVAGGMESMTNAPFLLPKGRSGVRLGHTQVYDHMMLDGLEDAYQPGESMGMFAESSASEYGFTREEQDDFSITSLQRAKQAIEEGAFTAEIAPVTVSTRQGDRVVDTDEQPGKSDPEKIPLLKPAFKKGGTITAGSASSISDGAAALTLCTQATADSLGARPLARIVAHAGHAQAPQTFCTAPVTAINNVLKKADWAADDVDLWEVNEAFAVVSMISMKAIGIPHEKLNIHGGACALGHPIGASGARIIVTLLHALQKTGGRRGVAALCIGGGEATAVAIELM